MAVHAVHPRRFTVDEYLRMGEIGIFAEGQRVELVDGEIRDVAPRTPRRAAVVARLVACLRSLPHDVHVRCGSPVRLGDLSLPEPDVAVVRGRPADHIDAHPAAADVLLAIEVADETGDHDVGERAFLYARHGVAEFWMVDLAMEQAILHRDPNPARYRTAVCGERASTWASASVPSIRLRGEDVLG